MRIRYMARVRSIPSSELPADLAAAYENYATQYGPFRNQVAVLAHVPAALDHLTAMLLELRAAATLPKRYLEIAIVVVSQLNECHYCVAHHKPALVVEGLSPEGVDRIRDHEDHPELDDTDKLVVRWAEAVTLDPHRIRDGLFDALREKFTEAQIVELTLRTALTGFFNRFNDVLQIEDDEAGPAERAAGEPAHA